MRTLFSLFIIFLLLFNAEPNWSASSKKKTVKKTTKTHRVYKAKLPRQKKRVKIKRALRRTIPRPVRYIKSSPRPPFDEQTVESVLNCSSYFCYVKFKSGEEGYSEVAHPGAVVYAPKKGALYISKKKMDNRLKELKTQKNSP